MWLHLHPSKETLPNIQKLMQALQAYQLHKQENNDKNWLLIVLEALQYAKYIA